MSINLAKPMETVLQNPFVLCAWPSFADQPYINNYRICEHHSSQLRVISLSCYRMMVSLHIQFSTIP